MLLMKANCNHKDEIIKDALEVVRELRLILRDNHAIAFTGEFVRAVASLDERTIEILNRSEVREIMKEVEDG